MSVGIKQQAEFFRRHWRQEPCLLRGFMSERELSSFTLDRFFCWCRPPVTARFFIRTEEEAAGTSKAAHLPQVTDGPGFFKHFRDRGDEFTLLLNKAQKADPELRQIQRRIGVPFSWRSHDTVATLSTVGSGIGFHAGHEDGFIIQLRGRRLWKLWASDCLGLNYRLKILGDPTKQDVQSPCRPECPPVFECELLPGDALMIPALMGHEGISLEESLSLSIAWRGITPFALLGATRIQFSPKGLLIIENNPESFFCLLPDPEDFNSDPADFLVDSMTEPLKLLGAEAPPTSVLKEAARRMLIAFREGSA